LLTLAGQFGGKGDGDEIALNERLWATANDAHGATFHFTLPTETSELSSFAT
jgi:hypothetical protein